MNINSEMIKKGIDESIIGQVLKGIVYGISIVCVIVILMVSYSFYSNYKWDKEHCGEDGCTITVTNAIDLCKKATGNNYLVCEVHNSKNESNGIASSPICGYQEANEWFTQIKKDFGGENAIINCE